MSETLHARLKGQGPKTIVLLHGFGGDHGEWTDIQPDLARDGLVLAYDLPGHGRSLDYGPSSGSATAKAILADLAARGHSSVHVAGFSMGGAIALLMALRASDQVASLTLLAPGGLGPEINGELLARFAAAPNADVLRQTMNEMSAPGYEMETRYVAGPAAMRFRSGQRSGLMEMVKGLAKDGKQGEISRDALAGLKMPVSVIWGTEDPVLPYAQTRNMPPNFVLHTIEGAGHMLPTEARKTVTAIIRRNVQAAAR